MSLIELMVAIALLGIVLAALAGTLVVTLGSMTQSEREVTATQLASELAEELQIGDFDAAALYEGEVATDSTWQERLKPDGTFEDRPLVLVSGPPASGREARYPEPVVFETLANLTYRADRYITWVDRDGDGNVETKRQTVFVSWSTPDGDPRELRFDSERVPTQGEAQATNSGTRVISFTFTPDPVELRSDTGNEGRLSQQVAVSVRTNEGTRDASLQLYTYDPDDGFVLRSPAITADPDGAAEPSGTGWVTWSATLPVSADYTFANGPIDVLFQAKDVDGGTVQALGTLDTFGGPYNVDTPTPDGTTSGEDEEPTEDPTTDPDPDTGDGDPVAITVQQRPARICVDSNSSNVSSDLYFRVAAEGLTQADGKVTLTYPYYQNKNNKNPNKVANDVMDIVEPVTDPPAYQTTIEAGSKVFKAGDTVTFTITATRADGAVDDDRDTTTIDLGVETC